MHKTNTHRILVAIVLLLFSLPGLAGADKPQAQSGVLDVRSWNFSTQGPLALDGVWDFYWNQLVSPDLFSSAVLPGKMPLFVPMTWNTKLNGNQNWGFGTYHLKILLPDNHPGLAIKIPAVGMSHLLYVDGVKIDQQGQVGTSAAGSVAGWHSEVHVIDKIGQVADVVIQVSNFTDQSGGLYNPLYLGETHSIFGLRQNNLLLDALIFGALFLMGIYYLGLYAYRRVDRSSLYFALVCICLSLRQLCYGEIAINDFLPGLPFIVVYRAGYVLYCGALVAFVHFIRSLFPVESWRPAIILLDLLSLVYGLTCLILPAWIFASLLIAYQMVTLAAGAYIIGVLSRALIYRRVGALSFLAGFLILFITVLHDIFKSYLNLTTPFLLPYGLLAFLFAQSLILTRKFAAAFAASEKFALYLETLNQSLERFIPRKVLAFLQKDSIVDIKLGDHIEREMTVMFADIRDFTGLSETLSPRENFNFINSYLKRMGPIIRKYQGFVDKYLGDGIMALFPGTPDHALIAALEMRDSLTEYNAFRAKMSYRPIRVGFGLHIGNLMLGTIGESQRMDSTVISDTVNIASRLEGLTKKFGVDLLTSEDFINRLEQPTQFEFRFVSAETVKGKVVPIKVFEVVSLRSDKE